MKIQESLVVADKTARRESMPKIAPIRRACNVVTDNTGLYLHSFSCFCVRNQVSQGHRSWCQWKANMSLPIRFIVTLAVPATVFEIFTPKDRKIAKILPTLTCLTPPRGGTPQDINIIYAPLKSTFNGLQFCR